MNEAITKLQHIKEELLKKSDVLAEEVNDVIEYLKGVNAVLALFVAR